MTALDALPQRLRSLADDCSKRARESDSVEAIRLYQQAEREARHAAVALHMGDYMRREVLARCEAMAAAARSYDGESIADEYDAAQERGEVKAANNVKTTSNAEAVSAPDIGLTHKDIHEAREIRDAAPAPPSVDAAHSAPRLGTAELAKLHGMTSRGALKRISNAYDSGRPGFYCHWRGARRRWSAEPDAFAEFRMSSDGAAHGTQAR